MTKFLITAAFLVFLFVQAQVAGNITGYAWSSNIGWISFSGDNYGVNLDSANIFSGYAWSPNVGWISFNAGDLTGCPASPCIAKATQVGGTRYVSGWAKVLSTNSWISLSGTTVGGAPYGVTIDAQGRFSGWAWENFVVGWVSFKGTAADGSLYGVFTQPLPAVCSFYAQPDSVLAFSKTVLYWNCQNVASCSLEGKAVPIPSGSSQVTIGKESAIYTLSCQALDGSAKDYFAQVKILKPGLKEVRP